MLDLQHLELGNCVFVAALAPVAERGHHKAPEGYVGGWARARREHEVAQAGHDPGADSVEETVSEAGYFRYVSSEKVETLKKYITRWSKVCLLAGIKTNHELSELSAVVSEWRKSELCINPLGFVNAKMFKII